MRGLLTFFLPWLKKKLSKPETTRKQGVSIIRAVESGSAVSDASVHLKTGPPAYAIETKVK